MADFEGAIREMSAKGDAAACVPAALKDAGLPVPQSFFIEAAMTGGMDVLKVAERLSYFPVDIKGLNLENLYKRFDELKSKGLHILVRLGIPTEIGIIGIHVNSIKGTAIVDKMPGFKLGGILPFGKEKGSEFSVEVLKHVVPENGIIALKQKNK